MIVWIWPERAAVRTSLCIEKRLVVEGVWIEEDRGEGSHFIARLSLLSVAQAELGYAGIVTSLGVVRCS